VLTNKQTNPPTHNKQTLLKTYYLHYTIAVWMVTLTWIRNILSVKSRYKITSVKLDCAS